VTPALGRCSVLTLAMLALGVVLRRPDIVALSAPFIFGPVLALSVTRRGGARVSLRVTANEVREDEVVEFGVAVDSDGPLDLVTISLAVDGFGATQAPIEWVTTVPAGGASEVVAALRPMRWGRQMIGPAVVIARGPACLVANAPIKLAGRIIRVLPRADVFTARGEVPHALAYAGDHRSSQVGPGVEFANVRPFSPGDRLRHINWRATLKSDEVHVTSTLTERSTEVVVLLDSSHDAGPLGGSILDIEVHAAAAIAEHYLAHGDLVAMEEYGGRRRSLRAGAGRRHADRVREWLMDVRRPIDGVALDDEMWLVSGAVSRRLVIVLSPLLDDGVATRLATLRARGSSVVAVDALPAGVRPPANDAIEEVARRLWILDREMLIARLGELGVPTVSWMGEGSLDAILGALVRIAAAPRVVLR
jgi:uncharacterized protein (DUF58 family)